MTDIFRCEKLSWEGYGYCNFHTVNALEEFADNRPVDYIDWTKNEARFQLELDGVER